ncbi:YtzH-like family protein [Gottfriedia acidiceleris]|uniref:YtzH-like family protein n=1 Tax=Gottfriedia acidiceleris TaxID=371036 RepID=UPI000B448017|nr:YtzH-like family protein [Gottfriedia acidiceleris]
MPLNHEHQLTILRDILMNHQSDCCGTVSECEQLERLVQSLLTNDQITDDVKSMLNDVYYYSQSGKYSSDLDQHITNHQNQLSQWVTDFNTYS